MTKHKKLKWPFWLGMCLSMVSLVIIGFWNQPIVRTYGIQSSKYKGDKPIKVMVLSDLHNTIYGKNQSKLIKLIKKQSPDIILCPGDMGDDRKDMNGSVTLFNGLQEYPIYYVTGNHECWADDYDEMMEVYRSKGVRILQNQADKVEVNGQTIRLLGIYDPDFKINQSSHQVMKESLASLPKIDSEDINILLSHRPEWFDLYANYGYDLVVSGHAHGGQVRIPFLVNGLFSPHQGFFPSYAGGSYSFPQANGHMIVSRGLSFNWLLPRIFNPPEIVIIEIE